MQKLFAHAERVSGLRNDALLRMHLPGKIPSSQVRALRELRASSEHGPLFSRFMVRGHGRRAPEA